MQSLLKGSSQSFIYIGCLSSYGSCHQTNGENGELGVTTIGEQEGANLFPERDSLTAQPVVHSQPTR